MNNAILDDELPYFQAVPVVRFLELAFGPRILDDTLSARKVFDDYINFSR